jgi:hypothetical protein
VLFATGIGMMLLAIVSLAGAIAGPDLVTADDADPVLRLTGIVLAASCGSVAMLLLYLDWPSRREVAPGRKRAGATVLSVREVGSLGGSSIVEVDLEVEPKGGGAYRVTRKFSAIRFGFNGPEPGRKVDVLIDPGNPELVELV